MKPTLKVPVTERLKLHDVQPVSTFAFTSNLRRYIVVSADPRDASSARLARAVAAGSKVAAGKAAGAYTRPVLSST
jgi:hypothetical protein